MNRAQKNAWFGLGFSLIATVLAVFIFVLSGFWTIQTFPWIFGVTGTTALAFIILLLFSFILRKRHSDDIEADERDQQISNRAIKISFISVWPLLLLTNIATIYFMGITGPIPAILFAFIHVGIFVFSAVIYFLSVLICYQSKGGAA